MAMLMCTATVLASTQRNQIPRASVKKVVVFGDATSDIKNTFALTGNQWPPEQFFDGNTGVFSNNLVYWQRLVREHLNWLDEEDNEEVQVWAFGGAGVDNVEFPHTSVTGFPPTIPVPGLKQQVFQYLATEPVPPPGTLFLIMLGNNDYLFAQQSPPDVSAITESIQNSILALLGSATDGGVYALAVSVTAIGDLPAVSASPPRPLVNQITDVHNAVLRQRIMGVDAAFAPVNRAIFVELAAEYARVRANPALYGFDQGPFGAPCLPPGAAEPCKRPDRYFWWDSLHYTDQAHRFVAERVWSEGFVQDDDDSASSSLTMSLLVIIASSIFVFFF
jgi:phospholipase/lecithinase/hemolysin